VVLSHLHSFSKGLGYEVARVFTENFELHVLSTMHGSFPEAELPAGGTAGAGLSQPLCSTYEDAARCVRNLLEVDLG
jgi:hypothetical protein